MTARTVTGETVVSELVEAYPGIEEVFLQHGVELDLDCPVSIQDQPLEWCEEVCHIDDMDELIADLNRWIAQRQGARVGA